MIFEVCVDSAAGAIAAQNGGADRVEVCANLVEGGTTPSAGLLRILRQRLSIRMNAMIRPRAGDFLYSKDEYLIMLEDVRIARDAGCDGVVFGLLTRSGDVDEERTARLVEAARPMRVTYHRAFDMARDAESALEAVIRTGADRLLTSGMKACATEGVEAIRKLVLQSEGRIIIMAGAGLNSRDLARFAAQSGVTEVHFSARKDLESQMEYRNPGVVMGKPYLPDEYHLKVTDAEKVREFIRAIQ